MDMPDTTDLTAVKVELAEIKGMLGRALSDNDRRLGTLEAGHISHGVALGEHGRVLSDHTAQLSDLRKDMGEMDARTAGALGKAAVVLSPIIAALALAFTVASNVAWN